MAAAAVHNARRPPRGRRDLAVVDETALVVIAAAVFLWGAVSARLERADLTAPPSTESSPGRHRQISEPALDRATTVRR